MSVAQQIAPHLPYLRRYARALTGSQKAGDSAVIAVLEALVADHVTLDRTLASRVALYNSSLTSGAACPRPARLRCRAVLPPSRNSKL